MQAQDPMVWFYGYKKFRVHSFLGKVSNGFDVSQLWIGIPFWDEWIMSLRTVRVLQDISDTILSALTRYFHRALGGPLRSSADVSRCVMKEWETRGRYMDSIGWGRASFPFSLHHVRLMFSPLRKHPPTFVTSSWSYYILMFSYYCVHQPFTYFWNLSKASRTFKL
jgi:hypothetical protein